VAGKFWMLVEHFVQIFVDGISKQMRSFQILIL
jgi:hypothetical protein